MGRLQNKDKSEDLPVIVKSVFSGIKAELSLIKRGLSFISIGV